MKLKACSLFASLFFALSSTAFSANIPITGEQIVTGETDWTFYATPVAAGATYSWHVYSGTIVAQNTDPAAGPLYVTIHWYQPGLYQDYVEISDNQGNSGIFDVYVGVNSFTTHETMSTLRLPLRAGENVMTVPMYVRLEAIRYIEEKRKKVA
ncbi:hypothetical protein FAM09_13320 [Niastella caeni]|uniref:PKD domain-containing protein n=1 Tax=Niastella caeni TaxID=2569763 RepID=A0A4S8HUZ7_9BACT|nr:hypothetical protein [Niastella caeni]THU39478.1 hypothetical protein FAM09_13320 [Niastella caeni]